MSRYIKKATYIERTGEIEPGCALYVFPDEESADIHFLRTKRPGQKMAEVTEEEYFLLQNLTPEGRPAYKIDADKIKSKLREREKELYEIQEHGITYEDLRPIKAVISKDEEPPEVVEGKQDRIA